MLIHLSSSKRDFHTGLQFFRSLPFRVGGRLILTTHHSLAYNLQPLPLPASPCPGIAGMYHQLQLKLFCMCFLLRGLGCFWGLVLLLRMPVSGRGAGRKGFWRTGKGKTEETKLSEAALFLVYPLSTPSCGLCRLILLPIWRNRQAGLGHHLPQG